MVVGVRAWDLLLPGCHSLKEKRGILQSLKAGLRRDLNVTVAETGQQDTWQRAEVACAAIGSDRTAVQGILRRADRKVEDADGVRIIGTQEAFL